MFRRRYRSRGQPVQSAGDQFHQIRNRGRRRSNRTRQDSSVCRGLLDGASIPRDGHRKHMEPTAAYSSRHVRGSWRATPVHPKEDGCRTSGTYPGHLGPKGARRIKTATVATNAPSYPKRTAAGIHAGLHHPSIRWLAFQISPSVRDIGAVERIRPLLARAAQKASSSVSALASDSTTRRRPGSEGQEDRRRRNPFSARQRSRPVQGLVTRRRRRSTPPPAQSAGEALRIHRT